MAIQNDIAPIFNGASWWISDDIFVWIPNSFQSNYNIDIFTNSKSIKLSKALIKDTWIIITETINCFLKVSNWDIFAFWKSWWVYRKVSWTWYKNSNTVPWEILSAIEFNWYLYFTTSNSLYKYLVSNISNTMGFSVYKTIETSNYHPFVIMANKLNIWCKTTIDRETAIWVYTVAYFTSNKLWEIKYLFMWSWNIKIYIYYSNLSKFELWYWDWLEELPAENIPLIWLNIEQIINKQGNDYILSNWYFWLIDWYNIHKVKQIDLYSKNLNSIISLWNKIYFWWVWWVYEWGALNKNYPDILSMSYWVSAWITSNIGAIFIDWIDLYVSWDNGGNYWIDKLSNTYVSQWYLITRVYYWKEKCLLKSSVWIKTAFNKLLNNDSISIYYRYNISWDYILLKDITVGWIRRNDFLDIIPLVWWWNFIEFKIILNSSSWVSTPELYEMFLYFNSTDLWQL